MSKIIAALVATLFAASAFAAAAAPAAAAAAALLLEEAGFVASVDAVDGVPVASVISVSNAARSSSERKSAIIVATC